ncbi:MAG: endonuclease/exonuclease/phosphatase family protein [Opitutaceae bacterium]|nr:endonuclease/exonuclease/phosphatase family protein [Opitutaceae bacterium]
MSIPRPSAQKLRRNGILYLPGLALLLALATGFQTPLHAAGAERAGAKSTFRAAQYNIRYDAPADVKSGNPWETRKDRIAELILKHDFDIVGTQEGNENQVEALKKLLPGYDYRGAPYGGKSHKNHTCSIFYKTSRYAALDSGVFWLSETPDEPSIGWDATDRRICHWAKFKDIPTGVEFYFFNVHFYWRYVTARQNSGALMAEKIKKIAGGSPVICTGDFNSSPSARRLDAVHALLRDAYDVTQTPRKGPEGTSFPGGVFEGTPGSRIDYIFVSSHFDVLSYAVLTDSYNNGHYPSDHLPVVCDMAFGKH